MVDLGFWAMGEYRIPAEKITKEVIAENEEEV